MRDLNIRRRVFEQTIALTIAQELQRSLGPGFQPEMLAGKSDDVCRIFGDALDSNGIVDEAAAERILAYVPPFLADLNSQFAELNARLDVACRRGQS
jgi:hypothetical protein